MCQLTHTKAKSAYLSYISHFRDLRNFFLDKFRNSCHRKFSGIVISLDSGLVDLGDTASLKREKQDISRGLVSTIAAILPSASSTKLEPARRGARNADLISNRRTYIRLRVHAISRSCPHLHAAVIIRPGLRDTMRYTGPLFGPRRKPGQGSISPSLSYFLRSACRRLLSFSRPGGSTRIQLPRQNQSWSLLDVRWWPFILIHVGDLER